MKFEIRASRNRVGSMDIISGTVFDERGFAESFIVSCDYPRAEIYLCISRGPLVKTVYDLFSKILKKYVKCIHGPIIKGKHSFDIPSSISYYMDENWIWSKWIPEVKTMEGLRKLRDEARVEFEKALEKAREKSEKLVKEAINEIWKICFEGEKKL